MALSGTLVIEAPKHLIGRQASHDEANSCQSWAWANRQDRHFVTSSLHRRCA
jgi:hypothetical protein